MEIKHVNASDELKTLSKKLMTGIVFVDQMEGLERKFAHEIALHSAFCNAVIQILMRSGLVTPDAINEHLTDALGDIVHGYDKAAAEKFGEGCFVGENCMVDKNGDSKSV